MPQPRGPEYHLPQHQRESNRPQRIWNNAKQRAKQKSLPFTITKEWVREKYENGICDATGLPFGPQGSAFAPSLDQVDPGKGYTPDNVNMTVWIHNRCKGNSSEADVLKFARAYAEFNQ